MFQCRRRALLLDQLDRDPPSDDRRRMLQAGKRDVVFRIKETVNLRAARLDPFARVRARTKPVVKSLPSIYHTGTLARRPTPDCDGVFPRFLRYRLPSDN